MKRYELDLRTGGLWPHPKGGWVRWADLLENGDVMRKHRLLGLLAEAQQDACVDEVPTLTTEPHEITEAYAAAEVVAMWDALKKRYEDKALQVASMALEIENLKERLAPTTEICKSEQAKLSAIDSLFSDLVTRADDTVGRVAELKAALLRWQAEAARAEGVQPQE